jgi:hypothetical protein
LCSTGSFHWPGSSRADGGNHPDLTALEHTERRGQAERPAAVAVVESLLAEHLRQLEPHN